jgi:hypothetical protein
MGQLLGGIMQTASPDVGVRGFHHMESRDFRAVFG